MPYNSAEIMTRRNALQHVPDEDIPRFVQGIYKRVLSERKLLVILCVVGLLLIGAAADEVASGALA